MSRVHRYQPTYHEPLVAAMIGCLGTANYYFTIPFLVVMFCVAMVQVWLPGWFPTGNLPRWRIRLLGLVGLVVAPVFIVLALEEAHERPNCEPTFESSTGATGQTRSMGSLEPVRFDQGADLTEERVVERLDDPVQQT